MANLTLGQPTAYPSHFDASLLQAVPRQLNRSSIAIDSAQLPFVGRDLWTCYELSWLQPNGLPQVAIAEVTVPATSPNLIESKSFKLYLNSYNQSVFASPAAVSHQLTTDLSACAEAAVHVRLFSLNEYTQHGLSSLPGECIDECIDASSPITDYDYQPNLLGQLTTANAPVVQEQLHSHLLKSNCLITNQPDWGSVYIRYTGRQINRQTLLRYLVSFRNHNEFHEQCVERIFSDLQKAAACSELTVLARYTRRGGLDINPLRMQHGGTLDEQLLRGRLARQ